MRRGNADLSQKTLIFLHRSILELDSSRLDDLLLFLLLVVIGSFGNSGLSTGFPVSLQSSLEDGLDQVVRSENLAGFSILDHPVGEPEAKQLRDKPTYTRGCADKPTSLLVNVTGSLEDVVQSHDGGVELRHVLFDDEMLPPGIQDVGLKR